MIILDENTKYIRAQLFFNKAVSVASAEKNIFYLFHYPTQQDRIEQTCGHVGMDILNILEANLNYQTTLTIFDRHFNKNGARSEYLANFIDTKTDSMFLPI